MLSSKSFLLKNKYKVILHDLFIVFMTFSKVSYIKLDYKLKIDPKMCTFKYGEVILKPGKKFEKLVATLNNIKFKHIYRGLC